MAFHTIQISHDEHSVRTYLERYKAFRLLALKTSPEAFGSTYARECAFMDDVWYNRLASPNATTFMTMDEDRIVCTLTAVGPLPCTVEQSSPTRDPWIPLDTIASDDPLPLHYRLNGMFTVPDARGKGLAKAIVERAIRAERSEQDRYTASIAVDADNFVAVSLYEKLGFVSVKEETMPGSTRLVILMKYSATPTQARPKDVC